jgi:hypothetical protein
MGENSPTLVTLLAADYLILYLPRHSLTLPPRARLISASYVSILNHGSIFSLFELFSRLGWD